MWLASVIRGIDCALRAKVSSCDGGRLVLAGVCQTASQAPILRVRLLQSPVVSAVCMRCSAAFHVRFHVPFPHVPPLAYSPSLQHLT